MFPAGIERLRSIPTLIAALALALCSHSSSYAQSATAPVGGSFHDTDTANCTAEDFRFTKGDTLYVVGLALPTNGEAVVRSLAATVASEPMASVTLLGGHASLHFEQRVDGLRVHLSGPPPAKYAYALRVKFQHAGR